MMSKKVAGLPVPVLGGIIIAGVLLGLWLRSRSASSSAAGVVAPSSSLDAATLGALTNAAAGGGIAPTTGLDPTLQAGLASSQDALVNQTNYMTALLGANVASSQALASTVTGDAFSFANHFLDVVPVYTYGSSPAGSSPAGQTNPPPPPPAPTPVPTPVPTPPAAPTPPAQLPRTTYSTNTYGPKITSVPIGAFK